MICPVCNEALIGFELDGIEIDRCLECGGTWLDAGELEQIAEFSGAGAGKLSAALTDSRGHKHGKRTCVRCPAKLMVVTVANIDMDHCAHGHGLWLDAGEMEALIGAFDQGEEGAVSKYFGELFQHDITDKGE